MKPECAECEATLKLALEKAARLEKALREVAQALAVVNSRPGFPVDEARKIIDAALRPEGT